MKVLDHGYVEFVEAWGTGYDGVGNPSDFEVGIIEAARMSTGKGFESWEKDQRLLKYLYEHKHSTPFEMAGMVLEIKAPIFIFREWHRHRTQSYNEMSARYIPLPNENYLPTLERVLANEKSNKQAQGTGAVLPELQAARFISDLQQHYTDGQDLYEEYLSYGVPKELARLCIPVGRYSRMRASANLRNWLSFLTLRLAPNAQWEIRQYAEAVGEIVKTVFPRTWELFKNESL